MSLPGRVSARASKVSGVVCGNHVASGWSLRRCAWLHNAPCGSDRPGRKPGKRDRSLPSCLVRCYCAVGTACSHRPRQGRARDSRADGARCKPGRDLNKRYLLIGAVPSPSSRRSECVRGPLRIHPTRKVTHAHELELDQARRPRPHDPPHQEQCPPQQDARRASPPQARRARPQGPRPPHAHRRLVLQAVLHDLFSSSSHSLQHPRQCATTSSPSSSPASP